MRIVSVLKKILGAFLLIFGIIALVTPLTPGAWLGLVGLELLGWGFLIPSWLRDKFKRKPKNPPTEV